MFNSKRLIIATLFGFITGILCYLGSKYGLQDDINTTMFFYILLNRALIGFVIGISIIQMHWVLHGILIGFIVGIPFSIGSLFEQNNTEVFIASIILSVVYGFIIELFTSVIFKAKIAPD